jgi:hypothetical protein
MAGIQLKSEFKPQIIGGAPNDIISLFSGHYTNSLKDETSDTSVDGSTEGNELSGCKWPGNIEK